MRDPSVYCLQGHPITPTTPLVTLRLPDVTGIPTLADDRRAPLHFVSFTPTRLHQRTPPRHRSPKGNTVNNLHLIGRLTKTPRLTYTTGDKARVNFTLAIDGYNNTVDYIPITAFGKLAETIHEHTDKGHLVAIEGRITSGKYTNDQGETVYTLDAIAGTCQFLSRPRTATTTPENVDTDTEVPAEGEVI
jgi:single-strand DNA-binding protein